MKSLLLKDFITMKKYARLMAVILIFYIALFGLLIKDITVVSLVLTIIMTVMPTATFSYDELCKWDTFALSLPVRKKDIVLSKYILTFIFAGFGAAFSLLFCFIFQNVTQESLLQVYFCLFYALFCTAIILPLLYLFGSVKARLLTIIIYLLPAFLFSFLVKTSAIQISTEAFFAFTSISPLLLIVFLILSYVISCWIFRRKER